VADAKGVRVRSGRRWSGVPWEQIDSVRVEGPAGRVGDSVLVVVPTSGHDEIRVPHGAAAKVSEPDLLGALTGLRAEHDRVVVAATVVTEAPPTRAPAAALSDSAADADDTMSFFRPDPDDDVATAQSAPAPTPEPATSARRVNPLRVVATARRAVRAQVHRAAPATVGSSALKQEPSVLPEISELRRTEGKVGLVIETVPAEQAASVGVADRATPVAVAATPVEAYPTHPASQPLIGPHLKAARTQLRITVDALAERTRIRPHVIESIEVDDFAPCGGDFYARGHVRSLSRTLGIDAAGLLEIYDREYAQAPVAARRVFEAELATGPQAAIRSTGGGPRWSVLLGVVMVLTIVWGAAKIVTDRTADSPGEANASVQPVLPVLPEPTSGATGLEGLGAPSVNSVKLVASARTRVAVRDADGSLVWRGVLAAGKHHRVDVDGRATVRAAKSAAVRLVVNGQPRGVVDKAGGPSQRTVGRVDP
jgi:hypothetical protein